MRSNLFTAGLGTLALTLVFAPAGRAFAASPVSGPTASAVLSPALRNVAPITANASDLKHLVTNAELPRHTPPAGAAPAREGARQSVAGSSAAAPTGVNFDGIGVSNSAPPDTNGAIGKNHYIQSVNSSFAIWDKSGNLLYGPAKINTLFQPLGGTCAAHNDGDPVVDYDAMADRWVITQFAVFSTDGSFSHECFAVSQTGDPLGAYYLYDFRTSVPDAGVFSDYPHMGIWPDGYYMATHQFAPNGSGGFGYDGQGLYVYDRVKMLAGQPAGFLFVQFDGYGGALPADADGLTPPPASSPNYLLTFGSPVRDTTVGNVLHIWKVKPTWGASPSLAVTGPVDVSTAAFNDQICTYQVATNAALGERPCIPQPQPATPEDWLDGITDRLMFRVGYRYFPNGTPDNPTPREALVLTHTVNAAAYQAGVRWYELRDPGGTPTIFQQATWAGGLGDTSHRFMGSIAMDNSGNILAGYTKSDLTFFPEIDVAGRLATDPPGVLGTETLVKASAGSQTGTGNRWGDYSEMSVDPFDGCTFWYTSEYLPGTGEFNWKTRIASFRFPSCAAPAKGTISGVVTDCATGQPLSRALVSVSNGFSGATDAAGRYSIVLPPGSYTVTASAPGRLCNASSSQTANVTNGGTATASFCLAGAGLLDLKAATMDDSGGNANGTINKNECVKVNVALANNGCAKTTGASGVLSTSTPGVTIGQPLSSYPDLAVDAAGSNVTPYTLSTGAGFVCGHPIDLTLSVSSSAGQRTLQFSLPTCESPSLTRSGSLTPDDSQQAARLGRDSNASSCASTKACPGALAGATGTRAYDAHTFTNTSSSDACITVHLDNDPACSGPNEIFSAAYLDAFDPQNLCTNYVADLGSSPSLGFHDYALTVPAGRTFVVVVATVSDGGVCSGYTMKVSGLVDEATTGSGPCAFSGTPPDAKDDAVATDEGTAVTIPVLANDTDGAAPPLTILQVGAPAHGTAVKNANNTVTYTPAAGFNSNLAGTDSFTYKISNAKGFTDTARVTVTVNALCTYTPAGDLSADFESGAGGWTVSTAVSAPGVNWSINADPTAANVQNHAFFTSDAVVGPKDDRLVSPLVNLSSTSQVRFEHRFNTEDAYDGGRLEVSLDGGTTWQEVTAAGGTFAQGGYTSVADGMPAAWSGLSASYPANDTVVVNVGALAGLNRRFRFRFVADGNTGLEGWHVDNVKITSTFTVGSCRPSVACMEDDAPQIEYSTAWHLITDPKASAGHFRLHTGDGTADVLRLAFTVPAGKIGAVVYSYAKSAKGGSATVFVDGVSKGTVSYNGPNGTLKAPEFGASFRVDNLAPGSHTLELRAFKGATYVDGFCFESAASTSQPAVGPGQTSSGTSPLAASQTLTSTLDLAAGTNEVSIAAEAPAGVPIKILLVDPKGKVLATADNATGIATIETPIASPGAYLFKLVNVSLGPVQVWTATTPLVAR